MLNDWFLAYLAFSDHWIGMLEGHSACVKEYVDCWLDWLVWLLACWVAMLWSVTMNLNCDVRRPFPIRVVNVQPELSMLWHVELQGRWQSTVCVIDIPFQFCYFSCASLRTFSDSSFLLIVLIARIGGLWENVVCWVSSGPRDKTGQYIRVPGEPTEDWEDDSRRSVLSIFHFSSVIL